MEEVAGQDETLGPMISMDWHLDKSYKNSMQGIVDGEEGAKNNLREKYVEQIFHPDCGELINEHPLGDPNQYR